MEKEPGEKLPADAGEPAEKSKRKEAESSLELLIGALFLVEEGKEIDLDQPLPALKHRIGAEEDKLRFSGAQSEGNKGSLLKSAVESVKNHFDDLPDDLKNEARGLVMQAELYLTHHRVELEIKSDHKKNNK